MNKTLKTTALALTIAGLGLTALQSSKLESDVKVVSEGQSATQEDPRGIYVQFDENGDIQAVVRSVRPPAHLQQVEASKVPNEGDKFDGERFIKGSELEKLTNIQDAIIEEGI